MLTAQELIETKILADTLAPKAHNPPITKHWEWEDLPETDLVPRASTLEERQRTCEDHMGAGSGTARVMTESCPLFGAPFKTTMILTMKYSFCLAGTGTQT